MTRHFNLGSFLHDTSKKEKEEREEKTSEVYEDKEDSSFSIPLPNSTFDSDIEESVDTLKSNQIVSETTQTLENKDVCVETSKENDLPLSSTVLDCENKDIKSSSEDSLSPENTEKDSSLTSSSADHQGDDEDYQPTQVMFHLEDKEGASLASDKEDSNGYKEEAETSSKDSVSDVVSLGEEEKHQILSQEDSQEKPSLDLTQNVVKDSEKDSVFKEPHIDGEDCIVFIDSCEELSSPSVKSNLVHDRLSLKNHGEVFKNSLVKDFSSLSSERVLANKPFDSSSLDRVFQSKLGALQKRLDDIVLAQKEIEKKALFYEEKNKECSHDIALLEKSYLDDIQSISDNARYVPYLYDFYKSLKLSYHSTAALESLWFLSDSAQRARSSDSRFSDLFLDKFEDYFKDYFETSSFLKSLEDLESEEKFCALVDLLCHISFFSSDMIFLESDDYDIAAQGLQFYSSSHLSNQKCSLYVSSIFEDFSFFKTLSSYSLSGLFLGDSSFYKNKIEMSSVQDILNQFSLEPHKDTSSSEVFKISQSLQEYFLKSLSFLDVSYFPLKESAVFKTVLRICLALKTISGESSQVSEKDIDFALYLYRLSFDKFYSFVPDDFKTVFMLIFDQFFEVKTMKNESQDQIIDHLSWLYNMHSSEKPLWIFRFLCGFRA